MTRSIIRGAVSVGALAMLASCGGAASTDVRASVAGTYQLSTVNGQPLPFTTSSGGAVVVITAGTLVAESNGAFTETITRTTTPPGGTATTATVAATGTYSLGNSVIVFTYADVGGPIGTLLGSITNTGVSIQNGANSFEYTK